MKIKKNKNKKKYYFFSIFFFIFFIFYYNIVIVNFIEYKKEVINKSSEIIDYKNTKVVDVKEIKEKVINSKIDKYEEDEKYNNEDFFIAKEYFQNHINKEILKNWKRPFNYEKGDYCRIEYNFIKNKLSIKYCSSGEVLKRSVQLSIDKNNIKLKNYYNNVDFSKEIMYFNFSKIEED